MTQTVATGLFALAITSVSFQVFIIVRLGTRMLWKPEILCWLHSRALSKIFGFAANATPQTGTPLGIPAAAGIRSRIRHRDYRRAIRSPKV
jgi:hypothetical protein